MSPPAPTLVLFGLGVASSTGKVMELCGVVENGEYPSFGGPESEGS